MFVLEVPVAMEIINLHPGGGGGGGGGGFVKLDVVR